MKYIGLLVIVLLCSSAILKKNANQTVTNQFKIDFPEAKKIKYHEPITDVSLLDINTTDTYKEKLVKVDFILNTEFGKTNSHVWYTATGEIVQSCIGISMEALPTSIKDALAENIKGELEKGWKIERCFKHDVKGQDSWYSQIISLRTGTFVEYKLLRINSKALLSKEDWALDPQSLFN